MRKIFLAVCMAGVLIAMAGCGERETASQEVASQQEEKQEESQEEKQEETSEIRSDQEFTGMDLKMKEGTLKIVVGDSFSLIGQNKESADYEITDGILYFKNSRGRDVVLTLPEDGKYDSVFIDVKDGHLYAEGALTVQELEVRAERSDVQLEGVCAEVSSVIDVDSGSVFWSGDPGTSVTADCKQGHLSFVISSEEAYNYELKASDGNIHVGKWDYHGRNIEETVDNGAERLMKLSCSKGDISVETGSTAVLNTDSDVTPI